MIGDGERIGEGEEERGKRGEGIGDEGGERQRKGE